MRRAVIVGGAGTVGRWIAAQLAPVAHCVQLDPRADGPQAIRLNVLSGGAEAQNALAGADAVILAVPAEVAIAALDWLAASAALPRGVVELLSAKTGFHRAAERAIPGLPLLGLDPMFRPVSGADTGPVLCIRPDQSMALHWIEDALEQAGQKLVQTTADAHDRVLGTVQGLVHTSVLSYGAALEALDTSPGSRQTLPFRCLTALFARLIEGAPHVYWEIQRHNPYTAAARQALLSALTEIDDLVTSGNAEGFVQRFDALGRTQLVDLKSASTDAARLFEVLQAEAARHG
jgi:4-amino-4-deoxyprephenate dehydrogenase